MQTRRRRTYTGVVWAIGQAVAGLRRSTLTPIARRAGIRNSARLRPYGSGFAVLKPSYYFPTTRSVMSPITRRSLPRRGLAFSQKAAGPFFPAFKQVQGNAAAGSGSGTTLSVAYTNPVTAGNLLIVSAVSRNGNSSLAWTFTDTQAATWTNDVQGSTTLLNNGIAHRVAQTSGPLTVTATSNESVLLTLRVDEYASVPGAIFSLDGPPSTTGGYGSAATSGNVSPTTTGLIYGLLNSPTSNGGALTGGAGFAVRYNLTADVSGRYDGMLVEDVLNNTKSPIAATATQTTNSNYNLMSAVAFKATPSPILPSPLTVPANHAGRMTLTLTGLGTFWINGTTVFSVSGAGATIVSQSITGPSSATIVVSTGASTGYATISDGTFSGTLTVSPTSLSVYPPGVGINSSLTVSATGVNTLLAIGAGVASAVFGFGSLGRLGIQYCRHQQYDGHLHADDRGELRHADIDRHQHHVDNDGSRRLSALADDRAFADILAGQSK